MFSFKDVYLNDYYTLIGPLERKTDLKNYHAYLNDYYYGEKTIEKAEVKMQKTVLQNILKNNYPDLVIGGELSNQLGTTNMSLADQNIPYMGIYSACATSAQGMIILANMITNKQIKSGLFLTSSHNLVAEKQLRYPIEYGSPKPIRSTFTITAALGMMFSSKPSKIRVVNGTIGKVIDSGVKDVHNVGAVMAPSAACTLMNHLKLTKTRIDEYDLILTGDLGTVGSEIFKEILRTKHKIKLTNHMDAGSIMYKNVEYSGASGPAILPLILLTKIIPNKKYKKILYLATGALYSQVLVFQKNSLPAVSHAITLEVN